MFSLRMTSPNLINVDVCGECRLCGLSIVMKNRRIEDRVKSKDCTEEQSRSFNYVMF
ncbi:hypothetical protein HanIR_Chr11g0549271 [Helianthus annuus]|nr:hypothetical protein HanIR_Chr11g0549271 [Helianthus annuus]